MTTAHPALAEIERLVDAFGAAAGEEFPGGAREATARTALLDAVRGALAPLTVGAALALPEVQRGEAVVEYVDMEADSADWLQVRVTGSGVPIGARIFGGSRWSPWQAGGWRPWGCDVAAPCRLVPLADADLDPATRGPMPGTTEGP